MSSFKDVRMYDENVHLHGGKGGMLNKGGKLHALVVLMHSLRLN